VVVPRKREGSERTRRGEASRALLLDRMFRVDRIAPPILVILDILSMWVLTEARPQE
jgi:hypothetical protein